ncbi:multiprotein-bridging factor 1 family protein [Novosphingobium sp. 9]|uniref:helix-turn-helix domain-containing protein n=1 Tax=Novosphingobium sp. 9 TaxID=2025349 RepID=UPI0021B588DF|nr:helix-turn-helix transcriptional regulator [Novosphingobium sp. 9]
MAGTLFTPEYKLFAQSLVAARQAAGLTQEQLASKLAKPQSYVSKIERSERRIDVIEFGHICVALGEEPGAMLAKIWQRLGPV